MRGCDGLSLHFRFVHSVNNGTGCCPSFLFSSCSFFLFPSFPPDSIYSVLNLSVSQLHLLLSFPSPHYKFTILFLAHHAPVYPATLGFHKFCLFHSLLVPPCFSLLGQTLTWIPTCSRPAPQNYVLINAKLIINSPTSLFVCFSLLISSFHLGGYVIACVHLSVGWFVTFKQKLLDRLWPNSEGECVSAQNRPHWLLVRTRTNGHQFFSHFL